jgi:hypothetical protein
MHGTDKFYYEATATEPHHARMWVCVAAWYKTQSSNGMLNAELGQVGSSRIYMGVEGLVPRLVQYRTDEIWKSIDISRGWERPKKCEVEKTCCLELQRMNGGMGTTGKQEGKKEMVVLQRFCPNRQRSNSIMVCHWGSILLEEASYK